MTSKKTRLNKITQAYTSIDDIKACQKARLTLSDIFALHEIIIELIDNHKSETIISSVAEWLRKQGAVVTPKGIGWAITI